MRSSRLGIPATDNGPPTRALIAYFDCIDDADYRGIDRAVLALEGHSRGTALHYEDDLVDARSDGINGDQVPLLILSLDVDQSRDEKLSPMKAIILSRGNDSSDYSSKNHSGGQWSVVSGQWSGTIGP